MRREEDAFKLVYVLSEGAAHRETVAAELPLATPCVTLRMTLTPTAYDAAQTVFAFSGDGQTFQTVGTPFAPARHTWVGARAGPVRHAARGRCGGRLGGLRAVRRQGVGGGSMTGEELCRVILANDLETLRQALPLQPTLLDEPGADGVRPGFLAARVGSLEMLKYLVEYGLRLNLNDVDNQGRDLLHYAAESGDVEKCRYLVEYGGMTRCAATSSSARPLTSPTTAAIRRWSVILPT